MDNGSEIASEIFFSNIDEMPSGPHDILLGKAYKDLIIISSLKIIGSITSWHLVSMCGKLPSSTL